MKCWLDTETKALLVGTPPDKLAPASTGTYTIVLLSIWHHDEPRLIRAFERIQVSSVEDAVLHIKNERPVVLKKALTHADALLGQFELISCDAISVFIRDEVVARGAPKYLNGLYELLLQSDEFSETSVLIQELPDDERGNAFIDQFVGLPRLSIPATMKVLSKKARIMCHWGNKIDGDVAVING